MKVKTDKQEMVEKDQLVTVGPKRRKQLLYNLQSQNSVTNLGNPLCGEVSFSLNTC